MANETMDLLERLRKSLDGAEPDALRDMVRKSPHRERPDRAIVNSRIGAS